MGLAAFLYDVAKRAVNYFCLKYVSFMLYEVPNLGANSYCIVLL